MLKVAVAFFGIPRNSDKCFASIEANILSQLPADCEIRCFYHLYKIDQVQNERSGENGALAEDNYRVFETMTGVLGSTDGILERWNFDRIQELGDTWGDQFASLRNLVYQLASLRAVTELVEAYDPDFVIFARPDLLYHDPLPAYPFSLAQARSRTVYIPNWQWWGGLNDRFAICGKDIYRSYGKRIERVFEFCRATGRKLHSERLLKYVLQRDRARVCVVSTRASRVRIDGKIVDECFSPKRGFGKRENRFYHPLARFRTLLDRRLR
ncbi:hypothetical protein [Pseudomonas entomophila]|uniref:hypothetical protein n=1 Tax=Pseudomonas sp. RIT-PI-S TaxID=3035295 RepID=UPI0021D9F3CD